MKKYSCLLLSFFFLFFLVSCDFFESSSNLKKFLKTEILISSDLECYYNGSDTTLDVVTNLQAKQIVYFDSTNCSISDVIYLFTWTKFIEYQDSVEDKFGVVFVFSPLLENYDEIKKQIIMNKNINAAIILDKKGYFNEQNSTIPSDVKYHVFLLDKSNNVVLAGSPRDNLRMWDLYKKEISRLTK